MKVTNYWSLLVYVEIKGIALSQEPEKKYIATGVSWNTDL